MFVDGIDFNESFAKNCEKQEWINRHAGLLAHLPDEECRKHLGSIYDRLTGKKTPKTDEV